jgi:hypothetical protein
MLNLTQLKYLEYIHNIDWMDIIFLILWFNLRIWYYFIRIKIFWWLLYFLFYYIWILIIQYTFIIPKIQFTLRLNHITLLYTWPRACHKKWWITIFFRRNSWWIQQLDCSFTIIFSFNIYLIYLSNYYRT